MKKFNLFISICVIVSSFYVTTATAQTTEQKALTIVQKMHVHDSLFLHVAGNRSGEFFSTSRLPASASRVCREILPKESEFVRIAFSYLDAELETSMVVFFDSCIESSYYRGYVESDGYVHKINASRFQKHIDEAVDALYELLKDYEPKVNDGIEI